jgi:CRP/FNR family transcriptional regulator, nitrogen oxide reductase regulator
LRGVRVELLRTSALFSCLGEVELHSLASSAIERNLSAGDRLFWEGDRPECFYVVGNGKVKVMSHSSHGKSFILGFFGPGETVGEVAVFNDEPYPATAEAVEATRVVGIRRCAFLSLIAANPELAFRVAGVLGQRLMEAQLRLKTLAGERVEQRLAMTLLLLSSKLGPVLPFTRQEVADMTGTTIETTIRFISRLKDGGIVRSDRGKLVILDEAKLRLLSEGPPQL